jgi:hypothetical protein
LTYVGIAVAWIIDVMKLFLMWRSEKNLKNSN